MTEEHLRLANLMGPCPRCGNGRLSVVVDADGLSNLLCRTCGSCWHAELEWTRRVDRATCPGCAWRDVCTAAEQPAFPA